MTGSKTLNESIENAILTSPVIVEKPINRTGNLKYLKSQDLRDMKSKLDIEFTLPDQKMINYSKNNIDFKNFKLKSSITSNRFYKEAIRENRVFDEVALMIKNHKKKLSKDKFLDSDTETVSNALAWYKKSMLNEISSNRLKSQNIELVESKLKESLKNKSEIAKQSECLKYKILERDNEIENAQQNIIRIKNVFETAKSDHKKQMLALKVDFETEEGRKIADLKTQNENLLEKEIQKVKEKSKDKIKKCDERLESALKSFRTMLERMDQKIKAEREANEKLVLEGLSKVNLANEKGREIDAFKERLKEKEEKVLELKKRNSEELLNCKELSGSSQRLKDELNKRNFELKTEQKLHSISKHELEEKLKKLKDIYEKAENLKNDLFDEKTLNKSVSLELEELKKLLGKETKNKKFQSEFHREKENELQKLRLENISLRQSRNSLEKNFKKLQNDNQEIQNFYLKGNKKEAHRTRAKSAKSKNSDFSLEEFLKSEMEKLKSKINDLEGEKIQNKEKQNELENKLIEEKTSFEKLRVSYENKLLDFKHQLKSSQSTSKLKNSTLGKNIDLQKNLKNELKTLKNRLEKLDSINSENEEKIMQLEDEKKDWEAKFMKKDEGLKRLQREISSKKGVNKNSQGRKYQLNLIELENLRQKNSDFEQNVKRLTSQIESSKKGENYYKVKYQEINKRKLKDSEKTRPCAQGHIITDVFTIYSRNSKRAKNIVDEEMKKMQDILTKRIYAKNRRKYPDKPESIKSVSEAVGKKMARKNLNENFDEILEDESDDYTPPNKPKVSTAPKAKKKTINPPKSKVKPSSKNISKNRSKPQNLSNFKTEKTFPKKEGNSSRLMPKREHKEVSEVIIRSDESSDDSFGIGKRKTGGLRERIERGK